MNNPVVAYTSKYGSTRRYALALGRRLGTPAVALSDLATASDADPLIVLAPVYATRILGRRRIIRAIRSAPARVALVVVAISPADDPGRGNLAARLIHASGRAVAAFNVRGDLDPARLTWPDRILIAALRRQLRRTPDTAAARMLLPGEPLTFYDETTLDPVVAWADRADPAP